MSIISVDLSIQSSSFAVYDGNKTKLYVYTNKTKKSFRIDTPTIKLTVIPHPKDLPEDDFQRYMVLADGLFYYMYQNLCDDTKVYLEGYSYASKGLVFNISEFCALFKRQLYPHYIPTIVPPSEWKKAIVGKGNATKETIYNHMLSTELREVLADLVVKGFTYKKGSWVEDVCDVYAISLYTRGL